MVRLKDYQQPMDKDTLQGFLHFRRRGGVSSEPKFGKGRYNRRDMKKGLREAYRKYV